MATPTLPFLEPIEEVRTRISELEAAGGSSPAAVEELARARRELDAAINQVFSSLTPWQQCQLARHPERPYTMAYIHSIFTDFTELHGDRRFADDPAIVAGLARFDGDPVVVLGHQKGRDTAEKLRRNFGMPRPEGYRKAIRIMELGARFRRPIISFIDTPGAYPGMDAEERGQAEAIAYNLIEMAGFPVPIIVVVTGEGGSGGALALGIGDRVLMLEYAWYTVISPEGCAAILWRDNANAPLAAEALKLTAPDLMELGIIDKILPEPPNGAHRDHDAAAGTVKQEIIRVLEELEKVPVDELLKNRLEKYRGMGVFKEE